MIKLGNDIKRNNFHKEINREASEQQEKVNTKEKIGNRHASLMVNFSQFI